MRAKQIVLKTKNANYFTKYEFVIETSRITVFQQSGHYVTPTFVTLLNRDKKKDIAKCLQLSEIQFAIRIMKTNTPLVLNVRRDL